MPGLIGEYECTLDPKGRVKLPSVLMKQVTELELGSVTMPEGVEGKVQKLIITRGLEKCLDIYPVSQWEIISKKVSSVNTFIKKNRDFVRLFMSGTNELNIDITDRILIPKLLLEYAGIKKDVVMLSLGNKVEVWDKAAYQKAIEMNADDFAGLAEEVMGGTPNE
ncbi:MAG: division/cell wall cluster transcriptional repressor MraZ [Fimbriimonadaceae bacterium]|nr:division/cell wall cluster transcriptional repressor MraZ [Chitinophagales bacterium]